MVDSKISPPISHLKAIALMVPIFGHSIQWLISGRLEGLPFQSVIMDISDSRLDIQRRQFPVVGTIKCSLVAYSQA
jgi:hypothetical protein